MIEERGKILTTSLGMEYLHAAVIQFPNKKLLAEFRIMEDNNRYLAKVISAAAKRYPNIIQPFNMHTYYMGVAGAHLALRKSYELGSCHLRPVTEEAIEEYLEVWRGLRDKGGLQGLIYGLHDRAETIMPEVYTMMFGDVYAPEGTIGIADVAIPTQLTLDRLNLTRLM